MNTLGNERIVPVMHSLPLIVLGTGMLSVILAGFAGSELPTMPTGAGIKQTEVLADIGLIRDEMTVQEVTSLPTADPIVAADGIGEAGQLFEPALMGGARTDASQAAIKIAVPNSFGELGAQTPMPKVASTLRPVEKTGGNWERRGFTRPRSTVPGITRFGGGTTEPVTTNNYLPVAAPAALVKAPTATDSGDSGVAMTAHAAPEAAVDFTPELTESVLPVVGVEDAVGDWMLPGQHSGDFDLAGGTLLFEIAGTEAGVDYDQLLVEGMANLDSGNVVFAFMDNFVADPTDFFDLILASEIYIGEDVDFYYGFFDLYAPKDLSFYSVVDDKFSMAELETDLEGVVNGQSVNFQELFRIQYNQGPGVKQVSELVEPTAVPLPGSLVLMGVGLLAVGGFRGQKA